MARPPPPKVLAWLCAIAMRMSSAGFLCEADQGVTQPGRETSHGLAGAEHREMRDIGPSTARFQASALEQSFQRVEGEVADVAGGARTCVEFDVVRRAAEQQVSAAAECHQSGG